MLRSFCTRNVYNNTLAAPARPLPPCPSLRHPLAYVNGRAQHASTTRVNRERARGTREQLFDAAGVSAFGYSVIRRGFASPLSSINDSPPFRSPCVISYVVSEGSSLSPLGDPPSGAERYSLRRVTRVIGKFRGEINNRARSANGGKFSRPAIAVFIVFAGRDDDSFEIPVRGVSLFALDRSGNLCALLAPVTRLCRRRYRALAWHMTSSHEATRVSAR